MVDMWLLCGKDASLLVGALMYVRPLREFNTVVWSPNTARDIDAIESVQRRPVDPWSVCVPIYPI